MTNPPHPQGLCEQIEHLVQEYITATRVAAQATLERAFATPAASSAKSTLEPNRTAGRSRSGARRASGELGMLGEWVYEAVCRMPGETMTMLAPVVSATARELNRPMLRLWSTRWSRARARCAGLSLTARAVGVLHRAVTDVRPSLLDRGRERVAHAGLHGAERAE